jgi:hypothetical protein
MRLFICLLFFTISFTSFTQTNKEVKFQINKKNDFIGIPIKFKYIEVAQYDIPKICTYDEALKIAKNIGNGWRLPSKDELLKMYEFRNKIKEFVWGDYYLTNEIYGSNLIFTVEFADGKLDKSLRYFNGNEIKYNVRLIRTIKK